MTYFWRSEEEEYSSSLEFFICYRILFRYVDDLTVLKFVGRTYALAFLASYSA